MRTLQTDAKIIGQEFDRLTVIRRDYQDENGVTFWFCTCKCGGNISTPLFPLRNGRTKSCGCLSRENTGKIRASHRQSTTREYAIWNGMKARCYNPKNKGYSRYGGKGIKVCQEWIDSFEAFIKHVGLPPSDGEFYSLDRIDSSGNYEPGNVRWANQETQCNNKKTNVSIAAFGRTMNLSQWSREVGLPRELIRSRMKAGWSAEKSLTTKAGRGRRKPASSEYEPFTWCS